MVFGCCVGFELFGVIVLSLYGWVYFIFLCLILCYYMCVDLFVLSGGLVVCGFGFGLFGFYVV